MHSSAAKFILSAILTEYRDFKRSAGDMLLTARRRSLPLTLELTLECVCTQLSRMWRGWFSLAGAAQSRVTELVFIFFTSKS